ncbi:hypothetical protein HBB16_02025 [Pseudonocardia sp. MCCB 268]|nr:hypothetical protein [Pseudonocardia cytotoxica]
MPPRPRADLPRLAADAALRMLMNNPTPRSPSGRRTLSSTAARARRPEPGRRSTRSSPARASSPDDETVDPVRQAGRRAAPTERAPVGAAGQLQPAADWADWSGVPPPRGRRADDTAR